MDISVYLKDKKEIIEEALDTLPFPDDSLSRHGESIRYSLMAGGKRIRPILFLAVVEALHADPSPYVSLACAIECIHTYSLIHDDLPAMDNDDLRRGRPTNHKVFGEGAAILAGDSLLTFAFEILSAKGIAPSLSDSARIKIIHMIAKASGPHGMVGGQALDLACEGRDISFETLRLIHARKTGALITASVQSGAVAGKATKDQFMFLTTYGEKIGLAFQMVDDLLNVVGDAELLGKATGSDEKRAKATYPGFFGLEETRVNVRRTVDEALEALRRFDEKSDPLRELAKYILARQE